MAKDWAESDPSVAALQRCVCFTETPLEQVWMMTKEIQFRQVRLRPYGLAFTKVFGRRRGANPVWYLDITPGHDWLTIPVNHLVKISQRGESRAIQGYHPTTPDGPLINPPLAQDPILMLTPFIEQMGPMSNGSRKEFWWEREWRKVGDFTFPPSFSQVVVAFVPEDDHLKFLKDLAAKLAKDVDWVEQRVPLLDPQWGLERMIARLARVGDSDVGPFTT